MAHLKHPIVGDPLYGGPLKLPKGATAGTGRGAARLQAPGAACRDAGVRAPGQRRAGALHRAGAGRHAARCCARCAPTPPRTRPTQAHAERCAPASAARRLAGAAAACRRSPRCATAPGVSRPPFDHFNLGLRCAATTRRGRAQSRRSWSSRLGAAVGAALAAAGAWHRASTLRCARSTSRRARSRRRGDVDAGHACSRSSPPTACRCCSPPTTAAKSAPRMPAGAAWPRACSKRPSRRCSTPPARCSPGSARPPGRRPTRSARRCYDAFVARDPGAAARVRQRPARTTGASTCTRWRGGASPRPGVDPRPWRRPVHDLRSAALLLAPPRPAHRADGDAGLVRMSGRSRRAPDLSVRACRRLSGGDDDRGVERRHASPRCIAACSAPTSTGCRRPCSTCIRAQDGGSTAARPRSSADAACCRGCAPVIA